MLKPSDIKFLNSFGISDKDATYQVDLLKKNDCFVTINAPATPEKGIVIDDNPQKLVANFDDKSKDYKICKFVPASGAATRMFKRLISFHQDPNLKNLNDGGFYSVKSGFEQIEKFAFFKTLKSCCDDLQDLEQLADKILYSGLGYAGIPKGLIEFHNYPDGSHTAFEEHLHEAAAMCPGAKDFTIHLTVSPEFEEAFKEKLSEIRKKTGYTFKVDFSVQEKSTDTISLYEDGELVRDNNSNLLLRPGGHGSLIQNLNKLESDIIFIKNIDNLTHGDYLPETVIWKKMLGGMLIELVENMSRINKAINSEPDSSVLNETAQYLSQNAGANFSNSQDLLADIRKFIYRPIRVCGMVKNTGEPGGGPFWVKDGSGNISLQIVEKAQINLSLPDQLEHFNNATHFNPVDLVCYLNDPDGNKFDLNKFVDKDAGFVSDKTYNGKNIRVLEHPGLWNGAMSDWITVFAEVPLITFNPVKELNDLLRKEHQPK
ncbi:MAG: DUF4301 family protein [Bacteroidales bacterium]|nr:DUF4301 family protein [Bacteroidales bacterium]